MIPLLISIALTATAASPSPTPSATATIAPDFIDCGIGFNENKSGADFFNEKDYQSAADSLEAAAENFAGCAIVSEESSRDAVYYIEAVTYSMAGAANCHLGHFVDEDRDFKAAQTVLAFLIAYTPSDAFYVDKATELKKVVDGIVSSPPRENC